MDILHELAHSYPDQFLGFNETRTIAAYEDAKASGFYEKLLLFNDDAVRRYALAHHNVYLAEGTEAFFNRDDFSPFVRPKPKLTIPPSTTCFWKSG